MNELVKAPAVPMVSDAMHRDPSENTAALLSLLQRNGLTAVIKTSVKFPTDPKTGETKGWREIVSGCAIALAPDANPAACLAAVDRSMSPAPDSDIRKWLVEVSAITARRSTDEAEAALTLVAYTSRLKAYPGDIVRQTLKDWDGKWWPTWGELKEILEARIAPRQAIKTALQDLRSDGGKEYKPRPRKDLANYLNELENGCTPFRMEFKDSDDKRDWLAMEILRVKAEMSEGSNV